MSEPIDFSDLVRENPDLTRQEKETTIRFAKDEDRATVFTAEGSLMRRLLKHPEFTVDDLTLDSGERVDSVEEVHADEDTVVGVMGSIPVGTLKVSKGARSTSRHSLIVSSATG